ncbi:Dynein light intermediate chain axonemal [Paragonimus heterotremus]|uniref:Dynein light intermediate chain axonemal n=1 Tax=Paragonimus heterotremus TaxID=100268 RepID=A0A8J4SJ65_9TREM|nr:Dynein light intermediate chain axonemal [Paragonimus heterotremus]
MHTLLRYDIPVPEDRQDCNKKKTPGTPPATYCPSSEKMPTTTKCGTAGACRLTREESVVQTLEQLFEPVRYKELGTKWVKHVFTKQATPLEMKQLEQEVDRLLRIRCSRKKPLCLIREDVLEDLIKEILRQVTIDCPEQGMLLKRILDHYKMEFVAYETLLRFANAFVGRKRTAWQHWKKDRQKKIAELEETKRILEFQSAELKHKVDQLERKNQEAKMKRDAARQEEIKFHKKRGEHLKTYFVGDPVEDDAAQH